jgi:protein tyrosine phosphatase
MWRSGLALRPYFHDVRMVVHNKAMFPDLQGFNIVDREALSFVHFPIRDCGITDDERVLELSRTLVKAISEGEIIYLHCWGGHGRTGTLVCIMLHLMYSVSISLTPLSPPFSSAAATCTASPSPSDLTIIIVYATNLASPTVGFRRGDD